MHDYALLSRTKDFAASRHVAVSGRDGDTVVLANGFGTDQTAWRHLLPRLEVRWRVVRFDWAVDAEHYDTARFGLIDGYAEDLLAVIDCTRSAPCSLVCHSIACMAAMVAAQYQPSLFRRMVMIAPSPCYLSHEGYPGAFDRDGLDRLLASMGEDYVAWVGGFAPVATATDGGDAAADEFRQCLLRMRPDVALSMASMIFTLDLRHRLGGFDVPTTIIQVADDPAVPAGVGRYLHRHWPNSRLEILDARGHLPQLTAPDQLAPVVEAALERPA